MDIKTPTSAATDPESKWTYRVSAYCAFAVVAGYLATFPLYARVGVPPSSGLEAQLEYFGSRATGWWIIAGIMIVTDLLLLPLFLGLFKALKGLGRDLLLSLATSSIVLFVAFDIAVTWISHSVLITSGSKYVLSNSIVTKAQLLASAAFPSAVLDSPVAGFGAIVFPSLGIFLAGIVMLRGIFGRTTAYLAVAAGVTALLFMFSYVVPALSPLRIINALLVTFWYLLAGIRLHKLSQQSIVG